MVITSAKNNERKLRWCQRQNTISHDNDIYELNYDCQQVRILSCELTKKSFAIAKKKNFNCAFINYSPSVDVFDTFPYIASWMNNCYKTGKKHTTKQQKRENEKNESILKKKNKDQISIELSVI